MWYPRIKSVQHDYFDNVQEAIETLEDNKEEIPEYFWAVKTCPIIKIPNAEKLIEESLEETNLEYDEIENVSVEGENELQAAIEKFNEINKEKVYYTIDYKKVIILKKNDHTKPDFKAP